MATQMLVIAGGDGYEEFTTSGSTQPGGAAQQPGPASSTTISASSDSDSAIDVGRDDSLNHLLIWEI